MRHHQVIVETGLPRGRRLEMALAGDAVLFGARDIPGARHQFAALPHRQSGARLDDRWQDRLEVARPQSEPGPSRWPKAAAAVALHQQFAIGIRKHHRRIAHRVDAAGDAGVDLAQRDLVGDQDRGLETGAAGALDVESRRLRIELGGHQCFAHQVEVPRMLDDRAADHIAEPMALQAEALDHGMQRRGQQFLVALARVGAVGAREGNAAAADDGDTPGCCKGQHDGLQDCGRRRERRWSRRMPACGQNCTAEGILVWRER